MHNPEAYLLPCEMPKNRARLTDLIVNVLLGGTMAGGNPDAARLMYGAVRQMIAARDLAVAAPPMDGVQLVPYGTVPSPDEIATEVQARFVGCGILGATDPVFATVPG